MQVWGKNEMWVHVVINMEWFGVSYLAPVSDEAYSNRSSAWPPGAQQIKGNEQAACNGSEVLLKVLGSSNNTNLSPGSEYCSQLDDIQTQVCTTLETQESLRVVSLLNPDSMISSPASLLGIRRLAVSESVLVRPPQTLNPARDELFSCSPLSGGT